MENATATKIDVNVDATSNVATISLVWCSRLSTDGLATTSQYFCCITAAINGYVIASYAPTANHAATTIASSNDA